MKYATEEAFVGANAFGKGAANTAYAQYFVGNSYLNPLTDPQVTALHLSNVTFEPGCRNNWHIHHATKGGGQLLICTAGEGWYQEWGKAPVALHEGMVITIPPEVKHWHGAKGDSWFSHIAMEVPGENASNEWCIAIIPLFLQAFTKDQAVIDLGVRYGRIVFGFSIIINADLAFEKIFQAVGRMKVTMVGLGLGCLANIILDPLLIFGLGPFPKMGIDGAALATGLGQVLTLVIYLLFYYLRPISVKIRLQHLRPSRHLVGRLYAIGIPAVLNLALPSVLISALNAILATFSQTYVLILGAYYKLQTFLYLSLIHI